MQNLAKLIRIERAFDYPDLVRAHFERHAPYRTTPWHHRVAEHAAPLADRAVLVINTERRSYDRD